MGNQEFKGISRPYGEKAMSEDGKSRLDIELQLVKDSPIPCVTIEFDKCKNDLGLWFGYFHSFKDEIYKNREIKFVLDFPMNYPNKPPLIYFPELFHPNVNPLDWHVCMPCLSDDYESSLKMISVIGEGMKVLKNPNPNSPLNKQAAELYMNDYEQFKEKLLVSLDENSK